MSLPERILEYLFNRHRRLLHAFYWGVIFLVYVIFFGRQSSSYGQTFLFVGLLLPITMLTVYFVNYFLIPRYLTTERYLYFILYLTYALVISVFLGMMLVLSIFIIMAGLEIRKMNVATIDFFFLFASLGLVVLLSMAIKLVMNWRKTHEDYQHLVRERVERELQFLKAQLNPHFLFNTLNNLYFLTTTKSDRAPEAIMQLSEMLDYVMHAGRSRFVELKDEWKQVQNYIALESLRCEDRLTITTDIRGAWHSFPMGPMLLITLAENAFKHGVYSMAGRTCIDIQIKEEEQQLTVMFTNNRTSAVQGHGIGLTNLRHQLDLLYGAGFEMIIDDQEADKFRISLILTRPA